MAGDLDIDVLAKELACQLIVLHERVLLEIHRYEFIKTQN